MGINKRISVSALVVALSFGMVNPLHANPSGATVVHGSASFTHPNANALHVTNSPGAIINWQQFGVGANEVTKFIQQSSSSAVLNRITGQNPSQILGSLTSNGRVFLVNPNGVVFGHNSVIDTAGLIASTLNISNNDFINNRLRFEDLANNAEILNQGFIHTSNNGEVVLIAPNVKNEGTIDVEDGKILLAAGQSATISSMSYDNIEFEVQAPENNVVNLGKLASDGGSIGVFAGSITNKGIVSANAIEVDAAGHIRFVAKTDNIQQDAIVTANSKTGKGGKIEILGDRVALLGETTVDASGATGGGEVLVGGDYLGSNPDVQNAAATAVENDVTIDVSATENGDGGKVIIWSNEVTKFYGTINAKGGNEFGDGGFVETSGKIYLESYGFVDASAANGIAGEWFLDPRNVELRVVATTTGDDSSNGAFNGFSPNVFTPSADTAIVDIDQIVLSLEAGTSVTIQTSGNGGIVQNGDITVFDPITLTLNSGNVLLTLNAENDININAAITATGANTLDLTLVADSDASGAGLINIISDVNLNGGVLDANTTGSGDVVMSGISTLTYATFNLNTLLVSGGTNVLNGTTSIAGLTQVTGGALNINNAADTVNLTLSGGSLGGSGALLVNGGAFNWTAGNLGIGGGTLTVNSAGSIIISGISSRNLNTYTLINNSTGLSNVWSMTGGGIGFNDGTFINNGTLDISSTRSISNGTGINVFTNNGTLTGNSSGIATINVAFDNAGTVDVQSNALNFTSTYTQAAGSTLLSGGNITVTTLTLTGGTLSGAGTITGDVANSGGIIQPGGAGVIGALNIIGNLTNATTGSIEIELNAGANGGIAGTDYDLLAITGQADLQSDLTLKTIGGYTVVNGDSITPITYGSHISDALVFTPISVETVAPTYNLIDLTIVLTTGFVFDADTNFNFNVASNWVGDVLPGSGDDVDIGAFNVFVNIGDNLSVNSLTIGLGDLTILSGALFTTKNLTLNGGSITNAENLTVITQFDWNGGLITGTAGQTFNVPTAIINITDGVGDSVIDTVNMTTNGIVNFTNGVNDLLFSNGVVWTVGAAGTLNLNATTLQSNLKDAVGDSIIVNLGTLNVNSSPNVDIGTQLDNQGTIHVINGVLKIENAATSSGTINIDAGAEFQINNVALGASLILTAGNITGSGLFTVDSNAFLDVGFVTSFAPTLTLELRDLGIIKNAQNLTLPGTFNWRGGTLTGIANTTISVPGLTTINIDTNTGTNNGDATLDSVNMTTDGIINITGQGDDFFLSNGVTLTIGSTGTLNINLNLTSSTSNIKQVGGDSTIVNQGILNINLMSSARQVDIRTLLDNQSSGTIHVINGTLKTENVVTNSGIINIDAGAEFQINTAITNSSLTFLAGSSVAGSGLFTVDKATFLDVFAPTTFASGLTLELRDTAIIKNAQNLTIPDTFDWKGGTVTGLAGQTFNIPSTATVNLITDDGTNDGDAILDTVNMFTTSGSTLNFNSTGGDLLLNNGALWTNAGTFNTLNTTGSADIINDDSTFVSFVNDVTGIINVLSTNMDLFTPFDNKGTLNVNTIFSTNRLSTNSGTITINTGATFRVDDGTNSLMTLQLGSIINGVGTFSVGTTSSFPAGLDIAAPLVMANTLTLQLDGTGTITNIQNLTIPNVFNFNGGTISGPGTFTTPVGSTVVMDNPTIQNLSWVNQGVVNWIPLSGASNFIFNGATFTNTGTLLMQNTVATSRVINLNSSSLLNSGAGIVNMNPASELVMLVPLTNNTSTGALNIQAATTLSDLTLSAGSVAGIGALTVRGGYTQSAGNLDLTGTIAVNGRTTLSGGNLNAGGKFNANGGLDVTGSVTLNRIGNVNGGSMSGSGAISDGGAGAFNLVGGVFTIANNSFINTGVNISLGAPLNNPPNAIGVSATVATLDIAGTLDVSANAIGITNNGGIIKLNGNVTGDVFNNLGVLSGVGTITGNVTNDGEITPGFSPGTLDIVGNLTLSTTSNLIIDIAGLTTPGVDYDLLTVSGVIDLAGTLTTVVDVSNYTALVGDTFVPITFGSKTGALDAFDTISPAPGFGYADSSSATAFQLLTTIVPSLKSLTDIVPNETIKFSEEVSVVERVEQRAKIEEKEQEAVLKKDEDEDDEKSNQRMVCS